MYRESNVYMTPLGTSKIPLRKLKSKNVIGTTVYYNPATGKELGRVANTDLSRMPAFMEKARKAQKEWEAFGFRKRRSMIRKVRDYIVSHGDDIAATVSSNSGKTRIDALATEVIPCALAADWYARNAGRVLRKEKLPSSSIIFFNKRNEIWRYPLGVVGIISPWNYPLSIPFGEVIMGLASGNAVLLKVSGATILVGLEIEKILEAAGLPDGLFHLIIGPGDKVLDSMLDNGVDKLFFTGSTATGREVIIKAAGHLIPVSLELGGKDAMIVLPDADLERAANGAAWAGYQNAGQSCGSVERLYVHEKVYDSFMKLLAEKTEALRFGEDADFGVEVGSMTTKDQWDTVNDHVNDAIKNGARIIARSDRGKQESGSFYPPLLLGNVDHSMKIMKLETFGPVIPVVKISTIDEAIQLANDSDMGLTASVWTRDNALGKRIADRLEAGVVTINDHLYTHGQPETPWSGWKSSGIGYTHAKLGLLEMTRAKLVNWDMLPSRRNIWWFPYDRKTYDRLSDTLRMIFPRSPGDIFGGGIRVLAFMVRKMFTPWKAR